MKLRNIISVRLLSLVYILVYTVVAKLCPNEIIKSVLSLPAFVILPYLCGSGFSFLVKAVGKRLIFLGYLASNHVDDHVSHFISMWLVGNLFLLSFSLFLQMFSLFNITFILYFSMFLSILSVIEVVLKKTHQNICTIIMNRKLDTIIFVVFLGIIPAIFYMTFLPYPQQYHTVLPMHNRVVLDILYNNPFASLPVSFSYTIAPYLPLSLLAEMGNIPAHIVFWAMPLLFYSMFTLGIFFFIRQLTGNQWLSILASFFAPWIMTYEGLFQENYSITPRAYIFMLFPYVLYYLRDLTQRENYGKKAIIKASVGATVCAALFIGSITFTLFLSSSIADARKWQLVAIATSFVAFLVLRFFNGGKTGRLFDRLFLVGLSFLVLHTYESLLYLSVAMLFIFIEQGLRTSRRAYLLSSLVVTPLAIIFFLRFLRLVTLPPIPISSMLLSNYFAPTPIADFHVLLTLLVKANTQIIVFLFLLGLIFAIFSSLLDRSVAIVCLLIITLYTFPDPFALRIGSTIAPFLVYIVSRFLFSLIDERRHVPNKQGYSRSRKLKIFKAIAILCILTPFIITPVQRYHHPFHVTDYEYATIAHLNSFMNKSTQLNTFVLSDPWTMTVFSGVSYIESPIPRIYLWSEYPDICKQIAQHLRTKIFLASTPSDVINAVWELQKICAENPDPSNGVLPIKNGSNIIFIITGRTLQWMRSENDPLPRQALDLSQFDSYYKPVMDYHYARGALINDLDPSYVKKVQIYAKNEDIQDHDITLKFAQSIDSDPVFSVNITIPSKSEGWFEEDNLTIYWPYSRMFVYHTELHPSLKTTWDSSPPFNYVEISPYTDNWSQDPKRNYWVHVYFSQTRNFDAENLVNMSIEEPRFLSQFSDENNFKVIFNVEGKIYVIQMLCNEQSKK